MEELKQQAIEISNACKEFNNILGRVQEKIIVPSVKSLTPEEKKRFNEEVDEFIENFEVPDLKANFRDFINKK